MNLVLSRAGNNRQYRAMRFTLSTTILIALLGCDASPTGDMAPSQSLDAGAFADATGHDLMVTDQGALDMAPLDVRPPLDIQNVDAGEPDAAPPSCPDLVSDRALDGVRTLGCRFVKGPAGDPTLLRGVVVSADSVDTPLGTSLHESVHFQQLVSSGASFVWLLAQWRGVEPFEEQYDGAYMRRLCRQAKAAKTAGLSVFLGLYQEGQAGYPRWLTDDNNEPRQTVWGRVWRRSPEKFVNMWRRLIDTCGDTEVALDGIQLLTGPTSDDPGHHETIEAAFTRIYEYATTVLGPLLLLSEPVAYPEMSTPLWLNVPDEVYAPALWPAANGPAASTEQREERLRSVLARSAEYRRPTLIRGVLDDPSANNALLSQVEESGLSLTLWHDGFGSPHSLRDQDGQPTERWTLFFGRPWPDRYSGTLQGFSRSLEGWNMTWTGDAGPNVFHVHTGMLRPPLEVKVPEHPDADLVYDFDPLNEVLTIFVSAPAGLMTLEISGEWPEQRSME